MLFFKPTAKAEIRMICPHCGMINEEELKIVSTDNPPKEYPFKCKRCLKKFSLVLYLVTMQNIRKDED